MNYLRQINLFEVIAEHRKLPIRVQVIYYKLLAMNNRLDWCEWFSTTNTYLMNKCGFSNEQSFIRARKTLIENGLIKFIAGRRGVPSKYSLVLLGNQPNNNRKTLNSSPSVDFLNEEKAISSQTNSAYDSYLLAKHQDIYKQAKQTKQSNSSYPVETVDNVDNFRSDNDETSINQSDLTGFLDYVDKVLYRCPAKKRLLNHVTASKYLAKSDLPTLCKALDTFVRKAGRHLNFFDILLAETPPENSQWQKHLAKNRPKRPNANCPKCNGEGFIFISPCEEYPQGIALECRCKYEN